MANQWVRLWVDLPTDPKWRTISKISNQPITVVVSIYIYLLVTAANATERGVTQCDAENVTSVFDLDMDQVLAVFDAMQGRVLDGVKLSGWEKRQPIRDDNSAERTKAYREKKKGVTQCDATVTQCDAPDKDKDKETTYPVWFEEFWKAYPKKRGKDAAVQAWKRKTKHGDLKQIIAAVERQKLSTDWQKEKGQFIPNPATWLNAGCWKDEDCEFVLQVSASPSGTCNLCVSLPGCNGKTTRSPACSKYEGGVSL